MPRNGLHLGGLNEYFQGVMLCHEMGCICVV
ncbi:hypothetical protein CIPAW_15G070700 [Carya illinoinensis]|uniref:Uncharacterized protein n=1 Tax=Carya illinoinensis TaxID=32201 RepID=A0A8T1N4X4_CARIL|nr:hypothetical protein CIPAW_15G070700 [Carya illinoinensis]